LHAYPEPEALASATDAARVLVIEDDESSMELVAAVLERSGHEVTGARSAEEAARLLRDFHPALVIVDIRLPGQDGLTLTRRLKADPRTSSIPVIALTAHASLADRDAALDAGCVAWMTKPLDTRLLARTLLGLLGQKSVSASSTLG
jgi:CheY-like chemotaxis protein